MKRSFRHHILAMRWKLRMAFNALVGVFTVATMRLMRLGNRKHLANFAGATMRRIGPWFPEHRVGRANLAAAFPEKSSEEIERILAGVWDNLGRVGIEFVHIDRFTVADASGDADAMFDEATWRQIQAAKSGGPVLCFCAHLANWELPASFTRYVDVDSTILYRPPNIRAVAEEIRRLRAGCMGTLVPTGFDAPIKLARAIERGGNVAMLIDQHETRGVEVTFFGRPCKASPLLAKLARHFDCSIRGLRTIRLPDRNKFMIEVTGPIEPVRDHEGKVDVLGTTQKITSVVESWVREHPEQWLWLHRRWR